MFRPVEMLAGFFNFQLFNMEKTLQPNEFMILGFQGMCVNEAILDCTRHIAKKHNLIIGSEFESFVVNTFSEEAVFTVAFIDINTKECKARMIKRVPPGTWQYTM